MRAALEQLIYPASEKPPSPLLRLLLVDEFLSSPDLPAAASAREFALNHLLTTFITEALSGLRQMLNLAPPMMDAPLQSVLQQVATDTVAQSSELLAWDWLYCRYVRVELNITPDVFSQTIYVDERTLRRYQQQAIKRLTDRLITEEWAARIRHRHRQLYAELPGGGKSLLIGRGDMLNRLETAITVAISQPIILTGAAGVGKTAVVEALMARLIEADEIDRLIWMHWPVSVEFAAQALSERLLPEAGQLTVRDYAQLYRLIIVLDDVTHWHSHSGPLQEWLESLYPARVILTSQSSIPLVKAAHVIVPELDQQAAALLLHDLLRADHYPEETWPDIQSAWQLAGGNPLALQWYVHNLRFSDTEAITVPDIRERFAQAAARLNDVARQTWFACALCPPGTITWDTIRQWWPEQPDSAITLLLQKHLLESIPNQVDAFTMTAAARRYIERLYQTDETCRVSVDGLVQQVDQRLNKQLDSLYDLCEYVLLSGWVKLPPEYRISWLKSLWREGINRGRCAAWRSLLQPDQLEIADFDLQIGYGSCLRRVGEWATAAKTFETVIVQAGRAGSFLDQAHALLEMAVVLRLQAQYELAAAHLNRAERAALQYHDDMLLENIKLEQAQISVDAGDLRSASALLAAIPPSKRMLLLYSEVALLSGEFERCRAAAHQAMSVYPCTAIEQARFFAIISRAHEQAGNLDAALSNASITLTLLETQHDPFALARAQSNLGAVLAKVERWEEASRLLRQAETTQAQLRDRVGLTVTQHNLKHVGQHFAG